MLLPALADLKHAILVKSVLARYSYVIPLGNCVLGLVSRIPLGTAPRFTPQRTGQTLRLDATVAQIHCTNTTIPAKHQLVLPAGLSIKHTLIGVSVKLCKLHTTTVTLFSWSLATAFRRFCDLLSDYSIISD